MEAQSKIQNRVIVLKHGGAPLVAEGFADDLSASSDPSLP